MSKGAGLAVGILGAVLLAGPTFAQAHPGGGGHGGGGAHAAAAPHFGGGAHFAPASRFGGGARAYGGYGAARGYGGAGYHGAYGGAYHGAAYAGRGYAGGYGRYGGYGGYHGYSAGAYWRGGYWRGGYWPRAYYGLGYSWFLASLPLAYATYWYGGTPYYYANDVYYTWNPDYSGYIATDPPPVEDSSGTAVAPDAPPPADAQQYPAQQYPADPNAIDPNVQPTPPPQAAPAPQAGAGDPSMGQQGRIFMYPKSGQSQEQQSTDRRECQQWAAEQAGAANAPDYQRAMVACIEGRGYSAE